ncbi:AAA family ATPase [Microbispora cellulosiformans]|uniref:AAA family ATPase n=1 Tax=Microbispora cellulosiformans TaxID=2614688 RepID=A0A5J5JZ45_9ACTN|nr:LuxR family transcriptional regulator [Microbispora cellulosiformans]KAA9375469.1 AAA family ATPase [Microbispora cellulosiformans]
MSVPPRRHPAFDDRPAIAAPAPHRPVSPLIGRESQRLEIEAAVQGLSQGRPAFLEISGDPGTGKTALLAEVVRVAREAEIAVFTGRPQPVDGDLAFGAIVDALDGRLSVAGGERLHRLPAAQRDVLAAVFPSLAADASAPSPPDVAAPYRVGHAVRLLLEDLASSRPVALVLDDLHQADAGTVDVVCRLMCTPPRAPVLLAFAHRHRQVSPRLRATADTAREVARLRLEPLAERHTEALLGEDLPARARGELYRASEGNPGYLRALADVLEQGPPGIDEADIAPVPPWFASALAAEVARLSPLGRLVVAACAVLGDPITVPSVAAIAEVGEQDAYSAIDEIASHDLIRLVAGTGRFGFRHSLVRRAVYHNVSPGWRLGAHARAAQSPAGGRVSAVETAPHLTRVATPGDHAAVALLAAAADEVEAARPRQAAQWRRAALELLPYDGNGPDGENAQVGTNAQTDRNQQHGENQRSGENGQAGVRTGLLLALGRACEAAGQLRQAGDALAEALRLIPYGAGGRRAVVAADHARLLHDLGRSGEARALVGTELAHTRDEADRAALSFERAWLEVSSGSPGAAHADATQAVHIADRLGLPLLGCAARGMLAVSAVLAGTPSAGTLDDLPRAAAVLDALPDEELTARPDAPLWIGWAALVLERPHDAIRHLDRAVAAGRSAGRQAVVSHALVARVAALCAAGLLTAAKDSADEAVRAAWLSGSAALRSSVLAARCLVTARMGDLDALRRHLAEYGTPVVQGWPWALAAGMVAEARPAAGGPDGGGIPIEVNGLTRPAADVWSDAVQPEATRWEAAQPGPTWWKAAIRTSPADPAVDPAIDPAFDPVPDSTTGRVAGLMTGTAADLTVPVIESAAAGPPGAGGPRSASGPPVAERPAAASLTARERQIARLVSEGLKNREIADRLYVTQKTVEMHLSRIFAKLGVSNRVGVARTLYATPTTSH